MNTDHIIVCSLSNMEYLGGHRCVVCVDSFSELEEAIDTTKRFDINTICFLLRFNLPLTNAEFPPRSTEIPLALYCDSAGNIKDLLLKVPLLKTMNIRVYLPASSENILAIRVLSSLGIACVVRFEGETIPWGELTDLASYAILGIRPHADIEPFVYIASKYHPQKRLSFGRVYFHDPQRYLHVNKDGEVFLSARDAEEGVHRLFRSVKEVERITECEEYQRRCESWREDFLKTDGCAFCPAYRICMGELTRQSGARNGCSDFLAEVMDMVELHQSVVSAQKYLWQL